MRKISLAEGEFYHVYNRGTDKRPIFLDDQDFERFLESMIEFNVSDPIGSLYQNSFRKTKLRGLASKCEEVSGKDEKLVEIIAYCLNPNHFHLLLKQVSEKGIEKYMQRLGTGYTMYFNHKYERTGSLFQGTFKAVHVDSNEYLLHVGAYVNLNFRVHQLRGLASKYRSSWAEYVGERSESKSLCNTDPILRQFRNIEDFTDFSEHSLFGTIERRGLLVKESLLE
jgi:putative transposase